MNGYLTTCIIKSKRQEEGSPRTRTNGRKYDDVLQFTEEADFIIRGLSYGVDALYYNDDEWRRHQKKNSCNTYYRQGESLGSLK
jgi:hypothetical protein